MFELKAKSENFEKFSKCLGIGQNLEKFSKCWRVSNKRSKSENFSKSQGRYEKVQVFDEAKIN